MQFRLVAAQFQHVPQGHERGPVPLEFRQGCQSGPHGGRVGVIAVVDEHDPAALLQVEALVVGVKQLQPVADDPGRDSQGVGCRGRRQGVVDVVPAEGCQ